MEKIIFFGQENNKYTLVNFKKKLEVINSDDEFESKRNGYLIYILESIVNNPEKWDRHCEMNIGWIGDHFLNTMSQPEGHFNKAYLDDMFSSAFRFLLEYYLSYNHDIDRTLEKAKDFAIDNMGLFIDVAKEQIDFALKQMPIAIMKYISHNEAVGSIRNLDTLKSELDSKKQSWNKYIEEKEERVNALKESLKNYESGFNFVGLYEGFDTLSSNKERERKNLLFWLKGLGGLIIFPLIVEMYIILSNLDKINEMQGALALSIVPMFSLVAIFIYFFRVVLSNYKSVKSQILQIELRKTLCRFIQHYSEHASGLRNNDKSSMEKFESIIFSPIVPDGGNIPATFDGIDQLGKLMKSIKQ